MHESDDTSFWERKRQMFGPLLEVEKIRLQSPICGQRQQTTTITRNRTTDQTEIQVVLILVNVLHWAKKEEDAVNIFNLLNSFTYEQREDTVSVGEVDWIVMIEQTCRTDLRMNGERTGGRWWKRPEKRLLDVMANNGTWPNLHTVLTRNYYDRLNVASTHQQKG